MLCMLCGKEAMDGYEQAPLGCSVVDEGGPHWVYCRACDCWTEHPDEAVKGVGGE